MSILKRCLRNEKGFTMIEMMVVLVIIAVLIAGGIKFYSGYMENARVTKAKAQISTMQAALDSYYAEKSEYPDTVDELLNAGIRVATGSTSNPFKLEATDPWGENYEYKVSGTGNNQYSVYTGHNKVQGKDGYRVIGKGQDGESSPPEVSNATP
ncbi:MAG: type II secretion system protein GspG [Thermoanaerobacter sp.]|nr:type II secretion system protein GspG [Thermoanaerobacter sp.]